MCPPLLAVAAIGLTAVSVGTSLYGASKASDAAAAKNAQDQRNYLATADNYERNAVAAEKNAGLVAEQMDWDVSRVRDKIARVKGAQRAAFGAAGVASGTGTAEDVALDSMIESEKDIFAVRWKAKVSSDNFKAEAENSRINAANARRGAIDTAAAKDNATAAPWISGIANAAGSVASLTNNNNVTRFGSSLFA